MKIFRYIAILAILISTVSCIQTDVDIPVTNGKTIQIIGHVQSFSDRNVDSRALKVGDESNVEALCLVVFNNNDVCTRKEYQPGNPTFTLTTDDLKDGYTLCMFANIPDPTLGAGNTLDEFKLIACPVTTVDIPELNGTKCFPMYGEKKIGGSLDAVIQIPLTALYAKVVVNIISNPDQTVAGHAPASFSLSKYEVHNVVESVDFVGGTISNKGVGGSNDGTAVSTVVYTARNITSDFAQANNQASFFFYLPERFLCPNQNVEEYVYPFGRIADLDEDEVRRYPQCYKPKYAKDCCGENVATFVRFYGEYIDHQGHNWNVSYDIYVGNDNYSNFDIERNVQYNNYVTIKGIATSSDATTGTISVDHRVNIARVNPIIVNFRREALLDSHFEVRPLRIRKNPNATGNYDDAKIKVEVVFADNDEAKTNDAKRWIGIERSFGNGVTQTASNNTYLVDSDLAPNRKNSAGKRKYFTTDLTTTTLAGNKTIEVPISDTDETVWIYVDECTEAGDDVRAAKIKLTVLLNGAEIGTTEYHINQRKLFPITYNGRTYHIEYHEEYLHNYDAEDQYGQTEYEGMPWGLDGVQLSSVHNSFYINENNTQWNTYVQNNPLLKYDFYIGKYDSFVDSHIEVHNFAGQEFTDEIFTKSKGKVNLLTTADSPSGAVEYCYNRNKRDASGNVVSVDWYLPSADELEDVMVGGYGTFEMFQDKYYWTSQPAYIRNAFYYQYNNNSNTITDAYAFIAFEDNKNYARATKVVYRGNDVYDYVQSGLNDVPNEGGHDMDTECIKQRAKVLGYFNVMYAWYREQNSSTTTKTFTTDDHFNAIQDGNKTGIRYHVHCGHLYDMKQDGYHERTKYNRVRCLRKNNEPFVNATFNRWQATDNSSVTNENSNYILVDQNISYYVTISADSAPTSVKIGGVGATQNGTTSGTGTSNTVWYVEKSWSSKGVYQMNIEVTVDGKNYTFKNVGSVTVYGGYKVSDTPATSLKKDGKTVYVMQNTNYTSTWLTTSGTNVAASNSIDEYSFVTIEDGDKIKSVEKGTYFSGTTNNVPLNSGTNYTITLQSGQNYRITYTYRSGYYNTTYYLRQTDNTTVSMSSSTNTNRNWNFYEVTYDMP